MLLYVAEALTGGTKQTCNGGYPLSHVGKHGLVLNSPRPGDHMTRLKTNRLVSLDWQQPCLWAWNFRKE